MEDVNKKPNVFGGFEALSRSLLAGQGSNVEDDDIPYVDPEDLKEDEDVDKDVDVEEDVDDEKEIEEPEEKQVKVDDKRPKKPETDVESDVSEEDVELETEVTSFLKDRLSEELGWNLDEEDKFESLKDVVDYMKLLVEENSKPKYYSEEIEKLDEYVKNGGSVEKFFKEVYGSPVGLDYDSIDLTRESNQRAVVKELLKVKGYNDDRIEKTLDRYEKSEILEVEAEEAVELLKEYKKVNEKKLLEDQEKMAIQSKEQQQNFYKNVQESVKTLNNIMGIKISGKEKEELLDYIFKVDSNGLTKYQKDYMSDIKNLIESAYFTKKGDSLINKAKEKGSSDAYKEFHQKLKADKGKRSKNVGNLESSSESDILSSLSRNLLNKV